MMRITQVVVRGTIDGSDIPRDIEALDLRTRAMLDAPADAILEYAEVLSPDPWDITFEMRYIFPVHI